ncbi:hypothetical protein Goshw_001470 [Gossypium schwendimanii]|uniref:Uncharacterized protein n=1 Tax=Gossypium schwendimanii TaxID=34291 RepID=A0A7J9MZ86_GOSSC|nr:hypothetical protein [Gossypium schwendimanii]
MVGSMVKLDVYTDCACRG